jgi:HSP20 family protein
MTNVTEQFKQGVGHALESLSDGWRELKARAGGAMTRFRSHEPQETGQENWPEAAFQPAMMSRWAFMAADLFDEDERVLVRLEAPGMQREDFAIEVIGSTLRIRGEKRLDREIKRDAYALVQCAYGAFQRDIALPVPVQADKARATYRDGVLRIELPKAEGARRRQIAVQVH